MYLANIHQLSSGLFAVVAVLAGIASPAAYSQSAASSYPNKPIKMVVAWAPGGATDILARWVGVEMGKTLGQAVVIDNKPGATGTMGQAQVATAAPDGYTIVLATNSTYGVAPHLFKTMPYKQETAFAPISMVASSPLILAVRPTLNVKTAADLIDMARKEPGKLNFSSGGSGSTSHLAGELFMASTGVVLTHVPYKGGGPATLAVATGEIDAGFVDMGVALPMIAAGKLKAIGVTGSTRSSLLPDVPTVGNSGVPQFESTTKFALFAPAGTPKPIVDKLNEAVRIALQSADLKEKFARQGVDAVGGTPDELWTDVAAESAKWGRIITERRITVD